MSKVYDYYSGGVSDYLSQASGPTYCTGGTSYRKRDTTAWDDVDEVSEVVFAAAKEQARHALDNEIVKEVLYNALLFVFQAGLYVVIRIGEQYGYTGRF